MFATFRFLLGLGLLGLFVPYVPVEQLQHKEVVPLPGVKAPTSSVVLQVTVLRVSEDLFETNGLGDPNGIHYLDEKGVHKLLETVQSSQTSSVLACPQLCMLHGQEGTVHIGQEWVGYSELTVCRKNGKTVVVPKRETVELGIKFAVTPRIAKDGQRVHLDFAGRLKEPLDKSEPTASEKVTIESPQGQATFELEWLNHQEFSFENALTVGVGETVVVHGIRRHKAAKEASSCAFISQKLPCLNRWFRPFVGCSMKRDCVLFMIQPTKVMEEVAE